MKLTNVLVATNMNPLYYKFIPIFIKAWNKLCPNIKVTILVIAQKLIDELLPYKENIVLFPPIENMDTGFIAQNIRLLYPALMDAEGGILITDMDMIPMNAPYYTQQIVKYDNSKFISYRPPPTPNEICMCYNIATPDIWREVFNINNIQDIHTTLKHLYQNKKYKGEYGGIQYKVGWITDQLYLFEKVKKWHEKTNNHIIIDDKYYNRLCRARPHAFYNFDLLKSLIKKAHYSDYHAHRPYDRYKQIVDIIVEILPTN